ncbi:uncharacterized protein [Brachyistius frenatus]|uniref:uncharacterized protein n=1 Tax=Brachyistius frenatus TaxID=100188 RepID=UPI0037E9BDFC
MILTARGLCLPSRATVQELFSAARDASVIPDISLDPVLTTFLSLDSSAALQHQYAFLQRSMSREQQAAFGLNLTAELGGSRVAYGGVGVVALALSVLFDQVAHQVRAQGSAESQRSQPPRIFGISTSSRIGRIVHDYLRLVPGIANDREKTAETTELYDNLLKLELLDHYDRMTTKKRMSSVSMQQWLAGAAVHLHVRIHQVRLQSVPLGSAESLRLSYKTGLGRLVQGYAAYLRRNVQETTGPAKPRTGTSSGPTRANAASITNSLLFNGSLVGPNISADKLNETSAFNLSSGSGEDFGLAELKGRSDTTAGMRNRKTLNASTGRGEEEDEGRLGLLVIEPSRNMSHEVRHHPCESPAIQQALVTRIMNAQDLERNRDFFIFPERVLYGLLRQNNDFQLGTN